MCVTNTALRRPHLVAPVLFLEGGGVTGQPVPCSASTLTNNTQNDNSRIVLDTRQAKPPRPKRRRKPQKPGKTAKNNERHFVVHKYHDHAQETQQEEYCSAKQRGSAAACKPGKRRSRHRGGVAVPFPLKLHTVLDQASDDVSLSSVISWQPHGRCFVIHNVKEFVNNVMPKFFRQSKLTSFQRQLNLYGFCRMTQGPDAGGYYHELFLRHKVFLCKRMSRTKVKGTKYKAASNPDQEPDFYTMSIVPSPVQVSSEDESGISRDSSCATLESRINSEPVPVGSTVEIVPDTDPLQATSTTEQFDIQDELYMLSSCDSALDFLADLDTGFITPEDELFEAKLEQDTQLGLMLECFLQN